MFQQLARLFTLGRHPMPGLTGSFAPVLAGKRGAARSRPRQPLLRCMWQSDRRTGSLKCRWVSDPAAETDSDWLPHPFFLGHLHAA